MKNTKISCQAIASITNISRMSLTCLYKFCQYTHTPYIGCLSISSNVF